MGMAGTGIAAAGAAAAAQEGRLPDGRYRQPWQAGLVLGVKRCCRTSTARLCGSPAPGAMPRVSGSTPLLQAGACRHRSCLSPPDTCLVMLALADPGAALLQVVKCTTRLDGDEEHPRYVIEMPRQGKASRSWSAGSRGAGVVCRAAAGRRVGPGLRQGDLHACIRVGGRQCACRTAAQARVQRQPLVAVCCGAGRAAGARGH